MWLTKQLLVEKDDVIHYLWNSNPTTRLQEVLHVPSTFGHGEFRLRDTETQFIQRGTNSRRVKINLSCTHHSRGGDVDTGDRPWSHMIGQVTEHYPICQSCSQVTRQRYL